MQHCFKLIVTVLLSDCFILLRNDVGLVTGVDLIAQSYLVYKSSIVLCNTNEKIRTPQHEMISIAFALVYQNSRFLIESNGLTVLATLQ